MEFELKEGVYFRDLEWSKHFGVVTKIEGAKYYFKGFTIHGKPTLNTWYLNGRTIFLHATPEQIEILNNTFNTMENNFTITVNGERIELTEEQLRKAGIQIKKDFWKNRKLYKYDYFNVFHSKDQFDCLLPTKEHAEADIIKNRLLCKQFEMNDGEVLESGVGVYSLDNGEFYIESISICGFLFKTLELAKQFLSENREDLLKIRILGY